MRSACSGFIILKTIMRLKHIIISLAAVLITSQAFACDASAFDQSEFAERCQKLMSYCEKAYIAYAAGHPDTDKRMNELSRDWVDFYLSHGNHDVQPANMAMINPEVWDKRMLELGKTVSHLIGKNISQDEYESILIRLSIFKNEEKLTKLHNCFKAADLCESDVKKIDDYKVWFDCRMGQPASVVFEYVMPYQKALRDFEIKATEPEEALQRYERLTANSTPELKQNMFNNINGEIKNLLEEWQKTFFYK